MHAISQSPRDPDFVQNPYPAYAAMRGQKLFYWEEYGTVAAAGTGLVNAILRDKRFGRAVPEAERAARPPHLAPFFAIDDNSMLERDPPAHTRLRGLVLRAFTPRRIRALAPMIRSLADALAAELPAEGDLLKTFCEPLPVRVIARLIGIPETRTPDLLTWSHAMVAMYQSRRDRAVEHAAARAAAAFSDYLDTLIAARRAEPRDDLLSGLIAARDAGDRLSEAELRATVILLLNAGHEATVAALGNGIKAMLESGHRHGPSLVEEILRFDPPLHVFERRALAPVTLAGHTFQPQDRVALVLGAAGRDARHKDPDRFDPTRERPQHLAFGAGLRAR
ncbi:MAG: cytochrome P450, partial [Pseudomonadota bacterium]